uniref:Uncharacterized protein n=1 Tax=Anguilla anguilla TaxID=7936 RepID=A0A0E9SU33_ANGAN
MGRGGTGLKQSIVTVGAKDRTGVIPWIQAEETGWSGL